MARVNFWFDGAGGSAVRADSYDELIAGAREDLDEGAWTLVSAPLIYYSRRWLGRLRFGMSDEGCRPRCARARGATTNMRFARFTIADLVRAVLLCAVAMAGLMFASTPWGISALSVALSILTLAVLGIIYRRGKHRAFWTGAVLCGWAYLTFSSGPWFLDYVRPKLITSRTLEWAYPWLIPPDRQASNPRFQLRPFELPPAFHRGRPHDRAIEQAGDRHLDQKRRRGSSCAACPGCRDRESERLGRQCHQRRRPPGQRRSIREAGGGEGLLAAVCSEAAHAQPD